MIHKAYKPNWRDYTVALLFIFLILVSMFQMKLNISTNLTLSGKPLAIGGLAGASLGIVCFFLKKSRFLFGIVVILSILWLIIPGDVFFASALFSCSSVCYISLFPYVATRIPLLPKNKKG